mgnify:CR=1 FL=1
MNTYEKGELAKDILLCFVSVSIGMGLIFVFAALPGLAHIFTLFDAKTGRERAKKDSIPLFFPSFLLLTAKKVDE